MLTMRSPRNEDINDFSVKRKIPFFLNKNNLHLNALAMSFLPSDVLIKEWKAFILKMYFNTLQKELSYNSV